MRLTDLIETFKGHDKVIFKLTGIGEMEYNTVEFKDAIDTIEALQQENERLNAALDKAVDMIGDNSRCPTDFNSRKCSDFENCLDCWKDWLLGGKEDV